MTENTWKSMVWRQFGAAIDMLENAIHACPDEVWGDRTRQPQFWYVAYHTLFFLDLYLAPGVEGFAPPPPFTSGELEDDVLPDRVYTRDELRAYLRHGRDKCRATIEGMTDEEAERRAGFDWLDLSRAELLLYNLRHVQHHAAQLNLILRQATGSAPRWVATEGAGQR
ncbi:MAG TPA: DinB family protein [Longimicrobium sp.]|jgi:hypothetical protein|nr:DinB family protein [Longimicrobium sp.]